ncbi:aldo/keto reductase [Propionivibrio dicarboxylicus]|uniref:Aldo/keto reductase n=1 Tax=Propionivibrio dicarboxylicus TaxID=83767 RepID=A0A1G7WEM2_9RHOO|nr:aldo/keto reductase [Propionivibrio dicarboxylicus]SDG70447.1 Aldo/keto reductase [Propionivibrio dicarboxylicus]
MKHVSLPAGELVPALGMGTWMIGESRARRAEEIATLQHGIDLGMTLIDTAEMYGEGESEKLVGEAIRGRRERVFLVSKVYPHNAGVKAAQAACERSLRRLGVDCLDLYLLHWRGSVPFEETIEAFEALKAAGKIRHFGVSNLDADDLNEWCDVTGGEALAVDQVLYNMTRRGIEWDLLPWCQERRIPVMAYSPIEQARLLRHRGFCDLARERGWKPAQLALAWLLQRDSVIAIPKASTRAHLEENFSALQCQLDAPVLAALDRLFPPPTRATPLEML